MGQLTTCLLLLHLCVAFFFQVPRHADYNQQSHFSTSSESSQPNPTEAHPTTNGGMQNGSSVGTCMYTLHTRFLHVFLRRFVMRFVVVIIDTISASEFSREVY